MPRQGVNLESFFERRVLLVSLLLICVTMMSPVTFAFVPLHARAVGVDNIGLYFVVSALASGLSRLVLGPLLDRGSRGLWIALGYGVLIPSFGIYAVATTIEVFLVAGTLNAIGHSLAQPALMAFAMDRAEPGRMGKAMATFSMFYRVGEGVGAPIAGALIVAFGYPSMYLGAMGYAVVGLVLTALNWGTAGRPTGRAGA
jgi:MFS family permease